MRPGQRHAEGLLTVREQQVPGFVDPEVPGHEDVVRPDVAGDGGVVVEDVAHQQDQPGRVHEPCARLGLSGAVVDQRQLLAELGRPRGGGGRDRQAGQRRPERVDGGGDVAPQLESRAVVVVVRRRDGVDVDDAAARVGVPDDGVVLDGVVADRDHQVGLVERQVGRLVLEQPDPAEVVVLEVPRDESGGLERLDHRQLGVADRARSARVPSSSAPRRPTSSTGRSAARISPAARSMSAGRGRPSLGGGEDLPARGRRGGEAAITLADSTTAAAPFGSVVAARKAFDDRLRHVVGVGRLDGRLRHRGEEGGGVHRLVGALEPVGQLHGAGQGDDRVLLGVRGQQPGREVGRARAGGHQHHAGDAGEPPDGGRHEGRVLLVPADDEPGPPSFESRRRRRRPSRRGCRRCTSPPRTPPPRSRGRHSGTVRWLSRSLLLRAVGPPVYPRSRRRPRRVLRAWIERGSSFVEAPRVRERRQSRPVDSQ